MIPYLGDFAEDETVYIYFNTFDSNDPSASVTVTDLIASDIFVYKDGSIADLVTDGASVTVDFDSRTGIHKIEIDTSAHADYAVGSDYMVSIVGATVDGATGGINAAIATFSIENRFNAAVTDGATLAAGAITDASLAGNMEIVFETDFATNYNTTRNAWVNNYTDIIGTIGNASFAAGALTSTEITSAAGCVTSATGLDLVLEDSTFLTALEAQVWDAVLSGASHNDATSAGRRLRQLNDSGLYEGGAVWYDDVNGAAGSTDFENGTVNNPCSAEADVVTLLASLGLTTVHCAPGSTYVMATAYNNNVFEGENWALQLASQDIAGTVIIGASVSGVATGTGTTQQFKDCIMGATSIIKGTHYINCGLAGTQTLTEAGDIFFDQCHSGVAGTGSVTFDFGAALNSSNLNVRHHSGGWTIANMGAGTGTYNGSFEGNGQIVWAASCSATSNASIRGNWKITDSASGAVTETLDDNQTKVDTLDADWANGGRLDLILDARMAEASIATTAGVVDNVNTVDGNVVGSVGSNVELGPAEVNAECDTAISDAALATAANLATVDTNVDNLNLGIIYGTAQTGTLSTTQCTSDLSGYTNDQLIGRVIIFTAGPADGEATDITDYASASGLLTFTALTLAPENGNAFKIV